jgi:hypothetical protein
MDEDVELSLKQAHDVRIIKMFIRGVIVAVALISGSCIVTSHYDTEKSVAANHYEVLKLYYGCVKDQRTLPLSGPISCGTPP